ncbi:MAG: hypothetical protein JWO30_4858 [Fibrobacteres bacterium]|nr:hypothetical protein [Fibrobacterota bacterium]
MKFTLTAGLVCVIMASLSWAGKQKIILRLREPLRAETVRIQVPELTNGRGETRDLETKVELGTQAKTEAPQSREATLKLNMLVRNIGKNGVQVTLTLPTPGYVEVVMMDFYGKNLATVFEGSVPAGVLPLRPFTIKDGDNNGIKFMTLRINGKVALKRVMTKVR